jgi:tRNA pseudouridine38-40 synthase
MKDFSVSSQPYGFSEELGMFGSVMESSNHENNERLVLIKVSGKSFVYRQVRNMVGCLVEVGRGNLDPEDVKHILETRDRRIAPAMAPSSGLFLVDVEHGQFKI